MINNVSMILLVIATRLEMVTSMCDGKPNSCPDPDYCLCERNGDVVVLVNCDGNELRALNHTPPGLPQNLEVFTADQGQITVITSDDFANCIHLEKLSLSTNYIWQVQAYAFSDLQKLQHLSLKNNLMNISNLAHFPLGILDNLTNLRTLEINLNQMEGINYRTDIFRGKPNLQSMAMDGLQNTNLPELSAGIDLSRLRKLEISNGLSKIVNTTFWYWRRLNITSLHVHSITQGPSDPQLEIIENEVCSTWSNLEELDLSYNPKLGFGESLCQCLSDLPIGSIQKIKLVGIVRNPEIYPTLIPNQFLTKLTKLPITFLDLSWNGIYGVNGSLQHHLKDIVHLDLSYNRFFGLERKIFSEISHLLNLRYLDISSQTRAYRLPQNVLPEVRNRILKSRKVAELSAGDSRYHPYGIRVFEDILLVFPPKITHLLISDVFDYGPMTLGSIITLTTSALFQVMDFSRNKIKSVGGPWKMFPGQSYAIRVLNMSDCSIEGIGSTFFSETIQIDNLDLSRNINLGNQLTNDHEGALMAYMQKANVKVLNLTLTNIKYIPPLFFSNISSLEVLILQNTALSSWNCNLQHMANLTFLDLSQNRLLFLLPTIWDSLDMMTSHKPLNLDVSFNPLQIQCGTLHFLKWIRRPQVHLCDIENIWLLRSDGDRNIEFFMYSNLTNLIHTLEVSCSSRTWLIVSGSSIGLCMLLVFVAVVIHHHRWNIRYFCINLVRRRKYQLLETERRYEYDAFVTYHHNDIHWVKHQLIPKLENGPGRPLKLCIHHRDFMPGDTIEDNICSSVEKSRKTLVILTRDAIKSSWCEYEIQMARMRSIDEGKEVIIVVALEDIPMREMTRILVNLRRTSTWLDWVPDPGVEQESFWRRLRRAISRPGDQPTRCLCGRTFYPDGTEAPPQ